jgi:guanosine-diphosphatase
MRACPLSIPECLGVQLISVPWCNRLSYFYDRLIPLGLGVDNTPFTVRDLGQLASDVCKGPNGGGGWDRFRSSREAMDELDDRPEYCLDLTFMHSLLSLGYDLADEREIKVGKKIGGVELGWSLGAAIAMLEDGEIECTASA